MKCGGSLIEEQLLFQVAGEGSNPISPLHIRVRRINRETVMNFYKKWHYLGETPIISTFDFGGYYKGFLVGGLSFGSPNATELDGYFDRHSQSGWWEIKRLAMDDRCKKNSESRFISICIKLLRKSTKVIGIVTYADTEVNHTGVIYKASGFTYKGLTAPKMDFWVDGKIQQRGKTSNKKGMWKPRSRKHLFVKILTPNKEER